MTNGYLDTVVDCIPGMKGIRLRDIPSFIRTTDADDVMLNFLKDESESSQRASAIVVNSFEALEKDVLDALNSINLPPVYSIGPLHKQLSQIPATDLDSVGSNLWKEDPRCLEWLDLMEPKSVVYVNFGSITVMTSEQLVEFAWGLANSKKTFLWIIRPDLVAGESAVVPPEVLEETKGRGLLASWCPQEQVLGHGAIGGFLTHSGWNSTLESIINGVPMICWPFFAEQPTNCRYCCEEWGIGMEIEGEVARGKIESLVRELMDGDKGKDMKKKAMELKKLAQDATSPNGSSCLNLKHLINEVLVPH